MFTSIKKTGAVIVSLALAAILAVPTLAFANVDPPDEDNPVEAEQVEETPIVISAPKADDDKSHEGSFSFAGTGNTVDKIAESGSLKFYTIKSPDNNVFYLAIDEKATSNNVYLLSQVNEDELASLAKGGSSNISDRLNQLQNNNPAPQPSETPATTAEPQDDKPEIPAGVAWAVIVALAATGAFGYYKIKLEPERNERKVEESRVQEFMNPAHSNAASTIPMDTDDDPLNS